MKFKRENMPNYYDYMKRNTLEFLENEKTNSDLLHEKNIGKIKYDNDNRLHKSSEIPNKNEYMKGNVFNFLQNEKIFTEITHENNIGKIKYKLNIPLEHDTYFPEKIDKNHESFTTSSIKVYSNLDDNHINGRTITETSTITKETKSEAKILTKSRTDFTGSAPKRYTTKCFITPVTVPVWFTESLTLKLDSTKRTYTEKVYFKNKLAPHKWSETMTTEVKTCPKSFVNEVSVPVEKSEIHYMSLEPQQLLVKAN